MNVTGVPAVVGSSPRVRGKRAVAAQVRGPEGLIPACAGKTDASVFGGGVGEAHPRVCGENIEPKIMPNPALGSSPRVRGKPARLRGATKWTRLIPACAGKTSDSLRSSLGDRAHPRVCGENIAWVVASAAAVGSSPRVRGKR